MPNALVTGGQGQLGRELQHASSASLTVCALGRDELDVTQSETIVEAFERVCPDVVINAAAYTAVDAAESAPSIAYMVNETGAENVARCCAQYRVPLIHVSTDFVFDGRAEQPYDETVEPAPLSVYAQSKLAGEVAVRRLHSDHLIVRTSWLYSTFGHNFAQTILRLARERDVLRIVADQIGSPTYARDLASALIDIGRQICDGNRARGTYHCCNGGRTTWHGFADAIVENARRHEELAVTEVVPITTKEYPLPAVRPAFSVLDCRRIADDFGIQLQMWDVAVAAMLAAQYSDVKSLGGLRTAGGEYSASRWNRGH